MPDGPERDALLQTAREQLVELDAAIRRKDREAISKHHDAIDEVIDTVNGGTPFASKCVHDGQTQSASELVMDALRPGDDPLTPPLLYGQPATFVVTPPSGRFRALVILDGLDDHMHIHAIDLHRPFLSPTGYRSHMAATRSDEDRKGPVNDIGIALDKIFDEAHKSKKGVMIEAKSFSGAPRELHPMAELALARLGPFEPNCPSGAVDDTPQLGMF